jgi:alkylation response protein AidB-like acyl-CoA dehydrogenase
MSSTESVEAFRLRARAWLADNMSPRDPDEGSQGFSYGTDEEELAVVQRNRDLQRKLFDGGFAGICFPAEYGGQGLSAAHANAFNEEIAGYEFPAKIQVPTFSPCAAVILEFGNEAQKAAHLPAILKGEEIWMQFLSEPSGGSDVAGAQTTAIRDGDEWVLNGSKIWTTGAWWSDWGLCLARTNWDVPKHRGLTVFMLKIHQPGIEVQRIEMLNGSKEFCQEYLDDVRIPDADRIGEVDDGWTVGTRWMFYEKSYAISPLTTRPEAPRDQAPTTANPLITRAREAGRLDDPVARDLIGEGHALSIAYRSLADRVSKGIAAGKLPDSAAAITRVMLADQTVRNLSITAELSGTSGVIWDESDTGGADAGVGILMRQVTSIAGGTTEISRNVISERVLGMPREKTMDKDIPFRDVPRGPTSH